MVFRALLDMEKLGLGLARHHNTILAISHLTNALQQLGMLDKPWDDFDAVVEQQKSALFGSAFPTKYSDVKPRLMTHMGFSAANFAHHNKTRGHGGYTKLRKNWDGVKFRKEPVGIIFRQYFAGNLTMEQCLFQLEALMENDKREGIDTSSAPVKLGDRRVGPMDFLRHLPTWFPSTVYTLVDLDYITLTRVCNKLLRLIRVMMNRACDNPWPFIPELKPEASSSVEFVHPYMACKSLRAPLTWGIVENEVDFRGEGCKGNTMLVVICDVLTKYLQRKE